MSLSWVPSSRSSSSADWTSDKISSSESILGDNEGSEGAEIGVPGVGVRGGLSFLALAGSVSSTSSGAFLFFTEGGVMMTGVGSCVSR